MSVKIIHLSDLHIGRDPSNDVEKSNFTNIIGKIKTDYNPAETLVIITGDIVDNGGEYVQYINAANAINTIQELSDSPTSFKVWPIPGNHEYGPGGIAKLCTLKNFKKEIIDKCSDPSLRDDFKYLQVREFFGHYFFGLDSLEESFPLPFPLLFSAPFENGELKSYQLEELKNELVKAKNNSPESKRIVFLHSHPFSFNKIFKRSHFHPIEQDVIPYLTNWKAFMEAISGLADVLLFGHKHYFADFSGSIISRTYNVPYILSCGKSTEGERGKEKGSPMYAINRFNQVDFTRPSGSGFYGWEITIDGTIQVVPLQY